MILERAVTNPWQDIQPPSEDVSARRIDSAHPLDLFWARDHIGQYLFICEADSGRTLSKSDIPELVGIIAEFLTLNNKTRLVLVLNEQANWEIFHALCCDLVQATRKADDFSVAFSIILRRLHRWHDFLKKAKTGLLPEEQIKGLIGELLFIKQHLAPSLGIESAVKYWIGPEGAPQDFNINECAVEVKSQSGASLPYVKISSADQLCPQLPSMYLYVVTLGRSDAENPDAVNLPVLKHDICSVLEVSSPQALERFNDLLFGLGYCDFDKYLDFSYVLSDEMMFEVGEGFPRICPQDLHEGVVKLTYNISINDCLPFMRWPEWLEEK
jgi:hypothetical protein